MGITELWRHLAADLQWDGNCRDCGVIKWQVCSGMGILATVAPSSGMGIETIRAPSISQLERQGVLAKEINNRHGTIIKVHS